MQAEEVKQTAEPKKKKLWTKARVDQTIFMTVLLIFPIAQFFVFYILVNFNSILLAFKEYVGDNLYVWIGFDNFGSFLRSFIIDPSMLVMLQNSAVMALFGIVMIFLNCIVTYMIYKKTFGSGFFKVILFLPSVISPIVLVVIYRNIIQYVLPALFNVSSIAEWLNAPQGFYTILILGGLFGFGPAVLVFLGTMSTINESLIEYARLDGMNAAREFWHIVLPQIWPTIISYTVITFATFFTNYGLIFAFFDAGKAEIAMQTLGYQLYVKVYASVNYYQYPEIAASGLLYTIITIPVVFLVKFLMEKFGPSET